MATYGQNIETIQTGVYGKDIRSAIADCLSGNLSSDFNNLVREYEDTAKSLAPPNPGAGILTVSLIGDSDYLLTISSSS